MKNLAIVDLSSEAQCLEDGAEMIVPTTEQIQKIRDMLRGRLGEDTYISWFRSLEIVRKSGSTLHVSVPTQFLKKWFQQHFSDVLMQSAARELGPIDRLDIALRVPMAAQPKPSDTAQSRDLDAVDSGGSAVATLRQDPG